MDVKGVNGYSTIDAYSAYATTQVPEKTEETASSALESEAAVYEKSSEAVTAKKTYTPDIDWVKQAEADAEALKTQLLSYVQESFKGQGNAIATSDDMWKFLASGNFTVSADVKAEAQKSLEDGGYWSAEKTADRIVEFAKKLTGGDPDKIEEMRNAIEQGFKEATKTWGKDLPDITNDTHDLITKKLDDWAAEAAQG